MTTTNAALRRWVEDVAALTKPASIHWCDGSDAEYQSLLDQMVANGDLLPLNPKTYPNCYLHRSNPSDVARVEHLTFVCTPEPEAAGPNNNWMAPDEAHAEMNALFAGAMQGRTMYVVPYCMGPIASPYARCGVEITDSAYVAANMRLMTRIRRVTWIRIAGSSCISRKNS
jgi:phosphoenolpyruvate carboxykinase (GTP)